MSGGEIQRAELFANVDTLMEWKKNFSHKQTELIAWQSQVGSSIKQLEESMETILKGCTTLVETNELMTTRLDESSKRIDIANKRIRRAEEAIERLTPR